MAVATFDTLKFANTLKSAGVPEKQAEAQAVAFAEVVQANFKELATKEDIALLRAELARIADTFKIDLARIAEAFKIDLSRTAETAKSDLDQAVQTVRQELALTRQELGAKIDTAIAKQSGEIYLLKWMFGATLSVVVTVLWLVIRLSFSRVP